MNIAIRPEIWRPILSFGFYCVHESQQQYVEKKVLVSWFGHFRGPFRKSTTTNTKKKFGFTSIYINYRLFAKEKSKQFHVLLCVLLHHWVWFTGSIWSHRPPSARRTSWGRRRTFSKGVSRFGSFPGNRRNLSSVRATTTRSSARANFCPMQFLIEKKGAHQISATFKVPPS